MITVRMHHHVAHEPYVDLNLPPEVAQGVWNNYWWIAPTLPRISSVNDTNGDTNSPVISELGVQEPDDATSAGEHSSPEHGISVEMAHEMAQDISPEVSLTPAHLTDRGRSQSPSPLIQEQTLSSSPLSQTQGNYHRRMHAHIQNLREFCDGLEYQLQFNDFRMLDVLEREGGPFLALVADCLQKEGRLVPINQSSAAPLSVSPNASSHMMDHLPSPSEQAMAGLQISSDFESNPGIYPRALDC